MNENLSPADIKAVVGDNNNGGYAYPAYPVFPYGGGYGNSGFGGDASWLWFILILAFMNGGWGNGFGGFGGNFSGVGNEYAWLSNGQKEIMQNTNDGFNTLQLANQLNDVNSGIQGLSTQICGCCGDIQQSLCSGFAGVNATVNSGFANAESSANARQMANMQQAFNNQLSTVQGFNSLNSALCNASADNRLGIANLNSTILSENCADRYEAANNTRDIIESGNRNSQAILDKLCQLELDGFKRENDQLRSQLQFANMQASQVQQTADIRASQAVTANQLVAELRSCPIPAQPVYRKSTDFYLPKQQQLRMWMQWKFLIK